MTGEIHIRAATSQEYATLGELMTRAYIALDGFPKPDEQPAYYERLANIGKLAEKPATTLLVAVTDNDELMGGCVYVNDMSQYRHKGFVTTLTDTSGMRLLAVDEKFRGKGVGKALTHACMQRARDAGHAQFVLHTTRAMQDAWAMYEKMGFARAEELDIAADGWEIFGFRMPLD
ncbi:MAG: GNAT family N-acetyltransferase [Gammaproteobacteria bacterium]|nr:GNAT family N-acetyltransferase [Gammaproteobacteria bacterium]